MRGLDWTLRGTFVHRLRLLNVSYSSFVCFPLKNVEVDPTVRFPGLHSAVCAGPRQRELHFLYVPQQEGERLARDRGLFFMETSALSDEQINELLQAVGESESYSPPPTRSSRFMAVCRCGENVGADAREPLESSMYQPEEQMYTSRHIQSSP